MTLALDTNILSAVFRGEESADAILAVLESWPPGTLVIHGAAFCEFLAAPGIQRETAFAFLQDTGVRVAWETSEEIWLAAASAFRSYAERRRQSGSGHPRRIMADFLIGAHAAVSAGELLTLDPQHDRQSFPGLMVLNPAE